MNNLQKVRHLFLSVFLISLVSLPNYSIAQTKEIAPPEPPFLNPPREFDRWQINVKSKNSADFGGSFKKIESIEYFKTQDIVKEIIEYSDNSKEERWYRGAVSIRPNRDYDQLDFILVGGEHGKFSEYADFYWLTTDQFDGIENFKGRKCYKFVLGKGSNLDTDPSDTS